MTSLRTAVLDGTDVSDEQELLKVIEFPLSADEKRAIRDRARKAADTMEEEATATWGKFGPELDTEARMALARAIDQAKRLRALANSLER